jgi:hypothetical protein
MEDYMTALHYQMQETWQTIRQALGSNGKKMQAQHAAGKRVAVRDVAKDDLVLIKRAPARNKLAPRLQGPYTVVDVIGSNVTVRDGQGKNIRAHKNQVRIFDKAIAVADGEEKDTPEKTMEKETPDETMEKDTPENTPPPAATPIPPPRRSKRLAQKH